MKSYFIGNETTIRSVYTPDTIDALTREAGLDATRTLTRADALNGAAHDADYLFSTWGMPAHSPDEIRAAFPNLRAVFYGAGSVKGFAAAFLDCGVRIVSAWGANAVPVAEYTVAQIILANKGFFPAARAASIGDRATALTAHRAAPGNYGCAVGLIGAGMIGSLVAEMLKAYHLRVKVYDPFLTPDRAAALGVTVCSLEELFATCQTISNHLANVPATVGMLNYDLFSRMGEHATFINTGRGAQVVEADLARALAECPGRTALLDVTDPEPPAADSPFYTLPNVVLTPHIAGSAGDEVARMGAYMLDEFRLLAADAPLRFEVTKPMLATMA